MIHSQEISPPASIQAFVKAIWCYERSVEGDTVQLPFFADGYPGLIFQESVTGMLVHPHEKSMPVLFLYGQTISPVKLELSGSFSIIIFQLYPLSLKNLFNLNPGSINDTCHCLQQIAGQDVSHVSAEILRHSGLQARVAMLIRIFLDLIEQRQLRFDPYSRQVIDYIIHKKGQVMVGQIADQFHLSKRSLERRFRDETGLSVKQFAKIIQFQASLKMLDTREFEKMNQVVYEHGFSDQSHFIRVFKFFTGQTPGKFLH